MAFNGRELGFAGLTDDRLSENDNGKRVWWRSAAECGGMPWNGKVEKIMGTGCNHHEMMVATKKETL